MSKKLNTKNIVLAPTWGGSRSGAGRKKTSPFVAHLARPQVEGRKYPLLITLRVRSGLASLTHQEVFNSFHKASLRARRFGLRIIEYRIFEKSIKLICEFKKREDLEKSFKSLNTALAIILKKKFKAEHGSAHQGPVFLGRYMLETIEDPRAYREILQELLLEDRDAAKPVPLHGVFSSSPLFQQWRPLLKGRPATAIHFLKKSGESYATTLTHAEEIAQIREITASPQFWFTKNALREA
jgi:hypothetical protein